MGDVARTRIAGIRDYYRRVTEVDIGDVARELLDGRIAHASDQLLQCDCPNHASDSKRSLHVMVDKQGWYCFGCGVGGDVLQLVEFIQSGEVTRGRNGAMPDSHRRARDYLAERTGLPPLSDHGLTPEQLAAAEEARAVELRVQGVLTALATFYHDRLLAAPEALDWFRGQYGISAETIAALKIGYASNQGVIRALTSTPDAFTPRELAASGAFRPTASDGLDPFLENRIVFPYWSRGRVVFLIGRKTPWTPDQPWEEGKYRKLPVHDERGHAHIAPCVNNSHLFNEDVLLSRPARVVITEGVTDCISLMERGFPAISPATVRIREEDWSRILPKLSGVRTVYVAQDNEPSGVGLTGALATARALHSQGIDTLVVILPLDAKREEARAALRDTYGIESGLEARDLKSRLDRLAATDRDAAARLLAEAKIDVNAYFAVGHTAAEFETLLATAKTPIEIAIDAAPADAKPEERERLLKPLLEEIARLDALEQTRHLRVLQERFGKKDLPIAALRKQVGAIERERRREEKKAKKRSKRASDADPGSCREAIESALQDIEETSGHPDFARAAETAYEWFTSHGARFFRTPAGEPFLFFEDEILWMDSNDRGKRRTYLGVMYKHTGLAPTTMGGRTFYDVLSSLASDRGEVRDHLSWLHTNVTRHTVYLNLNNDAREIAKVTARGIEILRNGGNDDGVILGTSYKTLPINFLPDVDLAEAERLFASLVTDNLTCSPNDRLLVSSWFMCFPLLDFAGTRPMLRFEGASGSGKTTAAKIISTVVFGSPQQKTGTNAANYVDGARNPLVVLDNIEARQLTEDLTAFILTCVTGITKEKRKGGTDSETVVEQPRCLLNTTGIEPLGSELSEALSRSFVIRFSLDEAPDAPFLEAEAIAKIREHRDLLLSLIIHRTARVLALLQAGAQARVMALLHRTLGAHAKRRANDYLALMYLMLISGEPPDEVERWLTTLHPVFANQVRTLNEVTGETARESNPIATVLAALFNRYRQALDSDDTSTATHVAKTARSAFLESYPLAFADDYTIRGTLARDLFVALKRFAKDAGLSFPMTTVQQFVQRFANDLPTVRRAGFEIRVNELAHRLRTYDIAQTRPSAESPDLSSNLPETPFHSVNT